MKKPEHKIDCAINATSVADEFAIFSCTCGYVPTPTPIEDKIKNIPNSSGSKNISVPSNIPTPTQETEEYKYCSCKFTGIDTLTQILWCKKHLTQREAAVRKNFEEEFYKIWSEVTHYYRHESRYIPGEAEKRLDGVGNIAGKIKIYLDQLQGEGFTPPQKETNENS